MKCTVCNGTGIDDDRMICYKCGGIGEVQMTNEEWLNSLALDTKAYWLSCICGRAVWEAKYDNNAEKGTLGYWEKWLKQPHNGG